MVRKSTLWYQMLQFPCYNSFKNYNIKLRSHLSKATDAQGFCFFFVDFHYVYEFLIKKVRQCQKKVYICTRNLTRVVVRCEESICIESAF